MTCSSFSVAASTSPVGTDSGAAVARAMSASSSAVHVAYVSLSNSAVFWSAVLEVGDRKRTL